MKYIVTITLSLFFAIQSIASTDVEICQEFVRQAENYKIAHLNEQCLSAAKAGNGPALYSVGVSYGYDGNNALEKKYYEKAASQGVVAAYLALGHAYQSKNKDKSIYWYERFAQTKLQGYGYASLLLAQLYLESGNTEASEHWLTVCKESPYGENCAL